jgi:hypothetical protein
MFFLAQHGTLMASGLAFRMNEGIEARVAAMR